jgi:hypothetical protein
MYKGIGLTVAVAMTAVVGTGAANAADKLKVGVTATLEGTYTVLGEDTAARPAARKSKPLSARPMPARIRLCVPPKNWSNRTRSTF